MNFVILVYVLIGLFSGLIIAYFFRSKPKKETSESLGLIQNQINELSRTLDRRLGESSRLMQQSSHSQFSESTKLVKDITERLAKLDETNRQVVGFADQLQGLQDILKNPKQRGVLGEYYLETVLKNVLPPSSFQMQYKFSDGEIVDAVIFLDKEKVLPIDSKFSLENYNKIVGERDQSEREKLEKIFRQDLKNRIDETAKYIRPKEGTMDFAFMFIPSEAIYYDLLINQLGAVKASTRDLIDYAFNQRRVIIVSPTSFMAYLQTVLQGLRALQIEESAKEIRKRVEELGRHLKNYDQFMNSLGGSLGTTVNHFNKASKEFKKIDKDVFRISGLETDIEPLVLEAPAKNLDE